MKKLLYAGIVGPLLFIVIFLLEGLTRPGYSAWRHYVSQLATGDGGWMQVANFLVTSGTLTLSGPGAPGPTGIPIPIPSPCPGFICDTGIPAVPGHFSFHPGPGVELNIQVNKLP